MRHDWTLLCTEVQAQDTGAIGLGNVFSTLQVSSPYGIVEHAASVLFDPPAILASHWTAEFNTERRVHSAIVQLLAPGGDRVLWADRLDFDFRDQTTFLMVYILQNMQFVGIGMYEFHVVLEDYTMVGEWGRASLTIGEK